MLKLNKKATAVFRTLIDGLQKPGDARKINNAGAGIMPVSVDFLRRCKQGEIYAIAHNYIHPSGDLVPDPDCEFLVATSGIYPMTYQDQFVYRRLIDIVDGVIHCNEKEQRDLVEFCNLWFGNLSEQFGDKLCSSQKSGNPDMELPDETDPARTT